MPRILLHNFHRSIKTLRESDRERMIGREQEKKREGVKSERARGTERDYGRDLTECIISTYSLHCSERETKRGREIDTEI